MASLLRRPWKQIKLLYGRKVHPSELSGISLIADLQIPAIGILHVEALEVLADHVRPRPEAAALEFSYGVSDYRRSTAFYRDLMGWEIKGDNRRSQCSMKIGNRGGIIIRNNLRAAGVIDHVSWGIEPWET